MLPPPPTSHAPLAMEIVAPAAAQQPSFTLPPDAVEYEKAAAASAAASLGEKSHGGGARNVAERKEWTASEDELIHSSVLAHGCKWRIIAAQLPGRSDDAVRNRWNRLKEAQAPKAPSAALGMALGLEADGEPSMASAEGSVSAGKGAARKARGSSLDEEGSSSKPERISWSRQEDETIVSSVAEIGHKWGRIAQRLPGRTEHAIRNRYSRLQSLLDQEKRVSLPALPMLRVPVAAF